jgi:two-component system nitrate/nitrite response regulator NarL
LWLDRETMGRIFKGFMTTPQIRKVNPEHVKQATLTAKERTIINAILTETGATNKMIADQLYISEHTLRNHLSSIYQKLEVSNRLALYVYAAKHQMGTTNPARDDLMSGDHPSHP